MYLLISGSFTKLSKERKCAELSMSEQIQLLWMMVQKIEI